MSEETNAMPAPKIDPETLAIRARPARPIRFRRGVLIGGAAAGSIGLVAIAWVALQPQVFRQVVQEGDLSQASQRPQSDGLGTLPVSYAEVPKLGPPLPGDLGRPILRAQERDATAIAPADVAAPARPAQDEHAASIKAARESGLMAQAGRGGGAPAAPPPPPLPQGEASAEQSPSDEQDRKSQFAGTLDRSGDVNPHSLSRSPSPNTLLAGSVISASLITGINSETPGLVTAQVTQHVYDTATGMILLVPQGARLIGSYDHVVAFGQSRALVVWRRIVMPDGGSIRLDNAPASDLSGYAGLADKVDFHTSRLLKGVALATLLGVGTELSVTGESDLVEALRESAQSNAARAGDRITQRNLDIAPTITIRPGMPVLLVVRKDLVLTPWTGREGQ